LPHEAGLDELVWWAHATMVAKALAKQLGFAPVKLEKLNEGGALAHARGHIWGQLIFQDVQERAVIDLRPCDRRKNWSRANFFEQRATPHSHSIVPGGLLVTSYTTRFTPFTSLMIRVAVSPRNFMSKG
jgi:hypothetical protein